jgi:hypothetical protein
MRRIGFVCIVVAALQPVAAAPPAKPPAKPAAAKPAAAALTLSAKEVEPGDPVLVTVTGVEERPKGTAGQTALVFFAVRGGWQAVFATPLEHAPDSVKVTVDRELAGSVAIKPHDFPREEHIKVPVEYGEPPADKRKVIDQDNIAVIEAARNDAPPMFAGKFGRPGTGPATSPYGAVRTWNDDPYESRHLGQDVAAPLGTPVRCVQRGKVTLVRDGFLMGGTVVVSHGVQSPDRHGRRRRRRGCDGQGARQGRPDRAHDGAAHSPRHLGAERLGQSGGVHAARHQAAARAAGEEMRSFAIRR